MNKVFKSYSDSAHSWLAVKRNLLVDLGLAEKVSGHSYLKGATAYLEEDVDLPLFKTAYEAKFGPFDTKNTDHGDRSWVRNLNSFTKSETVVPVTNDTAVTELTDL